MLASGSVILAFLVPVALLTGWGSVLAIPLLRGRRAYLRPWVSPALGFALVGAIAPSAGALGIPLRVIAWPLVAIAGIGGILLVREGAGGRWLRSHWPALLVVAGALGIAATPLALQGALTTVGGSIDAISYNVRSEYLQEHALRAPDIEAARPWLAWVAAQIDLLRVGDVYLLGLVAMVLSRRSFEVFSVLAALAHAHSAFGTYFFARVGLRAPRRVGVLAASLVALSNTLLWPGLDCSFSQALALAFVPVTFTAAAALARRPSAGLACAVGLLLAGLLALYPVFYVVASAALGILACLALTLLPRPERRRGRVLTFLLAGVVSLAAGPVGTARAIRELGFVGGMLGDRGVSAVGAGNILVYPPSPELLGLIGHAAAAHGDGLESGAVVVGAILSAFALVAALRGLLVGGPGTAIAPISILVSAGALAAHQRFVINPPAGYPYGYFKAVTILAIVLAPLVAAGLARGPWKRGYAVGAIGLAGALLTVSAGHALWTLRFSAATQVLASKELIEAANAAERLARGRTIEVAVERGPRENWLGYLLRDQSIVFRGGNALHPVAVPILAALPALTVADALREAGPTGDVPPGPASRILWEGTRFSLIERVDGRLAEWPLESASRWTDGPATVVLDRSRMEARVEIGGTRTSRPLPPGEVRTIQLDVAVPARAVLSGSEGDVPLEPGSWRLDWDGSCRQPFEIRLKEGVVVPGMVTLLAVPTGESGRCEEVLHGPRGYLEWSSSVEGSSLAGETLFVPPGDEGPVAYRVGLHVGGGHGGAHGWWGVYSVDLPRDGRPHRASLRLDLRARAGSGTVDGASARIEETNEDVARGRFVATLALWRMEPAPRQVATAEVLAFEVAGSGAPRIRSGSSNVRRWWSAP